MRTAVLGVGYLGRFHAQKYVALAPQMGFDFVGVFDANRVRSEFVAKELGVPLLESLEEVANKATAVTIASATKTHAELAHFFLSRGIHVNVEKPMTASVVEAEELVQLARSKNLVFGVGHSERFNPVFRELRQQFPQPQIIEFRRHAPFKTRGNDVSVILDLMIHDLDLTLQWNDPLERILSARSGAVVSETADWAEATLQMKSGRTVVVSCSRLAKQMTRSVRGLSGKVNFEGDLQAGRISWVGCKPGSDEPQEDEEVVLEKKDHLLEETRQFIEAVRGQRELEIPAEQGLAALRLAAEIERLSGLHST